MKNCGSVRLNRDRKRMQSDESLDNDCSLKKKTYKQFEFLSETQSNSNKAGNQNNPLFYNFGTYIYRFKRFIQQFLTSNS